MEKLIDAKLLKFLIVGIINTLVGAGIMFLLYNIFGCGYWVSSACNYIAGGTCSFLLNKYFTFKNNSKSFAQVVQFVILLVVCYLISYVGAKELVYRLLSESEESVKDNVAMLTGEALYFAINYIGQRFVVFAQKRKSQEDGNED